MVGPLCPVEKDDLFCLRRIILQAQYRFWHKLLMRHDRHPNGARNNDPDMSVIGWQGVIPKKLMIEGRGLVTHEDASFENVVKSYEDEAGWSERDVNGIPRF